ncbi:MAG: 4-(cytidine 5'-diphospho)-2-C-methyl-D-erythritol kinase [Bacteroidales bacterium]|nr:4-(cytidine 5'-diphospho)-2-C-methyl-D-erythritol kinase [Bacteroidales bacterium]
MICFPNAKINLGLQVIAKRADGYHNINTVFYPIPLCDILEIIPASDGITVFSSTGLNIPGDPASNLCRKAYQLLSDSFLTPDSILQSAKLLPPVKIHLHKVIPMGAGLGGGSSDGAHTLLLLNDLFELGLSHEALQDLARRLGSDCPFFIDNKPVFAFEKGDRFQSIKLNLEGYSLVVVAPDIHCDTTAAYTGIDPREPEIQLTEIVGRSVEQWNTVLVNDFEKTIFKKFPAIEDIKKQLYELGAVYVSMSGSGAALYGFFKVTPSLKGLFPGCFVWESSAI